MQPHLVGNIDFRIMMTDHWKSLAFALVCLALNSTFRKISTYVIVSHITFQCKLQSKEPNTKRHFPADIDLNLHWLQHLTSSMVPSIHSSLCVTNFIIQKFDHLLIHGPPKRSLNIEVVQNCEARNGNFQESRLSSRLVHFRVIYLEVP